MALTKVTNSMISGAVVNVFDHMTAAQIVAVQARDNSLDVSDAIQDAIDYVASKQGGVVFLPLGTYRVDTPINLTSDTGTSRAGVTLQGEGGGLSNCTAINGNTGGRLFDCVGTNFLMFRDFYVIAVGATPSTIIFQMSRGLDINFCHHNRLENVSISIPSIHAANNGFGTIGLLNIEGEDATYLNYFCSANSPVVLLRVNHTTGIVITSYVSIAATSTSFGQVVFLGKNTLQAWNSWQPAIHIDAVNTLIGHEMHFAGGTSPWDSDTTGTFEYAVRTGATNFVVMLSLIGLAESFPKFLLAQHTVQSLTANVFIAGTGAGADDDLVNMQSHALIDSNLQLAHGDAARRVMVIGTGIIQNTVLSGYNTKTSLERTLAANARYVSVANDLKTIKYGRKSLEGVSATIAQNVATPGAIFSYIGLPDVVSGSNSGYLSLIYSGVIRTLGVNTQAEEVSVANFTCHIDLVSSKTGTYVIGTPVTVLSTPVSGNAAVALITGFTVTAAIVANSLQVTGSATVSGTGAYTNGITLLGSVQILWDGFSLQGPSIS